MTKRINDFIDLTDYHPSAYGDGILPHFEYHFKCPKCDAHFWGRKPNICECGFKHYTNEERIEFLEDAITELTESVKQLSELTETMSKYILTTKK